MKKYEIVSSCTNLELTWIKESTLQKLGSTQRDPCYKYLVHIFIQV